MHFDNARPASAEDDHETKLREGVKWLSQMAKPNILAVANKLQVSHTTLRRRFLGMSVSRAEKHTRQQLLSPTQEEALVDWVLFLAATGHHVDKPSIRALAKDMIGRRPSKTWIRAFLDRHPELRLGKAYGLDPRRAQAFNRPVVSRYFAMLERLIRENDIPVENIYNMDEKGVQRGGGKKSSSKKYFMAAKKNVRTAYRFRSGNLELVTIIECVSADGTALQPGFVFSGKEFCPEWFTDNPGITVSMSENGWTDNVLGSDWLKENFVPQATARNQSGKPILLIYDGHGSHDTLPFIRYAREHNIILLCLPPHTTHKLQPLDVGVFGPFQRAWIEHCDEYLAQYDTDIPKEEFVFHYMQVRTASFKRSTIQSAWRTSGAWPVNYGVFTDDDFAPSVAFSTTANGYPATFPVDAIRAALQSDDAEQRLPICFNINALRVAIQPELGLEEEDSDPDDESEPDENIPPKPPLPPFSIDNQENIDPIQFLLPNVARGSPRIHLPTLNSISQTPCPSGSRTTRSAASDFTQAPRPKRARITHEYVSSLERQIDYYAAHVSLAGSQVMHYKKKVNAKEGRKAARPKLNVEARTLTSEEGIRLAEERDRQAQEKEAEKQRKDQEKETREQQEREYRNTHASTTVFRGSVTTKNKADLKLLAQALQLSLDGTNKDLIARIVSFLEGNLATWQDERFSGLGLGPGRARAPAPPAPLGSAPVSASTAPAASPIAGPSRLPLTDITPPIHIRHPLADITAQTSTRADIPPEFSHYLPNTGNQAYRLNTTSIPNTHRDFITPVYNNDSYLSTHSLNNSSSSLYNPSSSTPSIPSTPTPSYTDYSYYSSYNPSNNNPFAE